MKTIISIFMVLLVSGCAATDAPVYYNPNAAMMLDYSARILTPQYYGNPYIRPALHTTCTQTAGFVNCNSY